MKARGWWGCERQMLPILRLLPCNLLGFKSARAPPLVPYHLKVFHGTAEGLRVKAFVNNWYLFTPSADFCIPLKALCCASFRTSNCKALVLSTPAMLLYCEISLLTMPSQCPLCKVSKGLEANPPFGVLFFSCPHSELRV